MAEINVAEVDRDLFGVAALFAQPVSVSHAISTILMDGIWMVLASNSRVFCAAQPGTNKAHARAGGGKGGGKGGVKGRVKGASRPRGCDAVIFWAFSET
ncbi:hypothetical protein LMG27198_32700 [Methylocystis echinoides]|uniref:Uncharacterized protein n=1 Tax=Methylocystis echinoides TaxID=29468 RepID=A0A9W6GWK9_9HYPH|nr:hypothetical protein LMG27198_32700 [Methylocystis echinoides]